MKRVSLRWPLRRPGQARPWDEGFPLRAWQVAVCCTGPMASQAVITIRVQASRGASRISYTTKGRYVSLATNGLTDILPRQPIMPTSSPQAFWEAVIPIVLADITAGG